MRSPNRQQERKYFYKHVSADVAKTILRSRGMRWSSPRPTLRIPGFPREDMGSRRDIRVSSCLAASCRIQTVGSCQAALTYLANAAALCWSVRWEPGAMRNGRDGYVRRTLGAGHWSILDAS